MMLYALLFSLYIFGVVKAAEYFGQWVLYSRFAERKFEYGKLENTVLMLVLSGFSWIGYGLMRYNMHNERKQSLELVV